MRHPLKIVYALLTLALAQSLRAAIIIDDFDDLVEIHLPEMEDQPISTDDVGTLNALRTISIGESQTDPIGLVDVAITRSSHLSVRIDGQFIDDPLNTPILSVSSTYEFDSSTDLTEGGANDSLLINVGTFRGSGIPGALSVVAVDANDVFAAIVSGFSLPSESSYTIKLPFSSFGFRGGGGVGLADFSTIELLEVRIRLLQGSRNPDTNWFVQIDRISIGRTTSVPELCTWRLATMAFTAIAICLRC